MKIFKHIILISILSIVSNDIKGQCFFENIFPLNTGITKFDTHNKMAYFKNIKERIFFRNTDYYYKPDYLKGDSVLESNLTFEYNNHDCFDGDKNNLYIKFCDDKLYLMTIKLSFGKTRLKECNNNYNNLVSILKSKYKFSESFGIENIYTKEKTGEGYHFSLLPTEKRNKVKIQDVSIRFWVDYEMVLNEKTKEWSTTNNIEEYTIEINYVDLEGTKLTNQGYPVY